MTLSLSEFPRGIGKKPILGFKTSNRPFLASRNILKLQALETLAVETNGIQDALYCNAEQEIQWSDWTLV